MTLWTVFKKEILENPSRETLSQEASSETNHQFFSLAVLAIVLSAAALALAGFQKHVPLSSQMVVVDMTQLLREKAASLVAHEGMGKQGFGGDKGGKIAEQAKALRSLIDRYAAEKGVLVVAKGAVFGAQLQEVTDDIRSLL